MNIGRIVIGLCALLLCGGCITSKPDMADHYPAGYEAQCQRANDRAKGDVRNVLGHEPQRIFGWTVEIVPGEPCPYGGRALRSTQSPTGWAAALTGGCKTKIVEGRVTDGNLQHEAKHYWGYMNGISVGL